MIINIFHRLDIFQSWCRSNGGSTVGALTQIKAMPSTWSSGHCILPHLTLTEERKGWMEGRGNKERKAEGKIGNQFKNVLDEAIKLLALLTLNPGVHIF